MKNEGFIKKNLFILLARIIGILFNVSLLDNYSFSSDFLQEQRVNTLVDKDIVNVPPRYYWPIPFETLSKSKGKITNGYGLAQE